MLFGIITDQSVLYSSQGTIFLPGNKVTEHPTSGDDGGKFLFEVIPGRKRLNQFHHFLYFAEYNMVIAMLTGGRAETKTSGFDHSCRQ